MLVYTVIANCDAYPVYLISKLHNAWRPGGKSDKFGVSFLIGF